MRKNLNLPDRLVEALSEFRHTGRYKSETSAVIDLLEMSTGDIMEVNTYVYLAANSDNSLYKIGYSANPRYRQAGLICPNGGPAKILYFVRGGRVMEKSLHMLFSRHHYSGEWFAASDDIKDWFQGVDAEDDIGTFKSRKECRVTLTEDQHEALTYAAEKSGMALATYLRNCALKDAASMGIRAEAPRVD